MDLMGGDGFDGGGVLSVRVLLLCVHLPLTVLTTVLGMARFGLLNFAWDGSWSMEALARNQDNTLDKDD